MHPQHVLLFTLMSKFVPLDFRHQALSLTNDDEYNIDMLMMQCELKDQWPSYPPSLHIRSYYVFESYDL